MIPHVLRHLISDSSILHIYLSGKHPDGKQILLSLFLAERKTNVNLPDYVARNRKDKAFGKEVGLNSIIWSVFKQLTTEYLEMRNHRIFVKSKQLGNWQELLTRMPPLPLLGFMLFGHFRNPEIKEDAIRDYVEDFICPNCGRTAIPGPYYPQLRQLIRSEGGLDDLHIHLNGTTEVDHVWLHALENPFSFYKDLRTASSKELATEQLFQIEEGLTQKQIYDRLRLAGKLRDLMIGHLFRGEVICPVQLRFIANLEDMPLLNDHTPMRPHPLQCRYGRVLENFNSMSLEALFYVAAFRKMEDFKNSGDSPFAHAFYLYLLILGFFNKLVVQQTEQNGFDQFQKITVNGARSAAERTYLRRFDQINGNQCDYLGFIEGRFSPQKSASKNRRLIKSILQGFAKHHQDKEFNFELSRDISKKSEERLQLRLTAHFIKTADKVEKQGIKVRHHNLRLELEQKAHALLAALRNSGLIKKYVLGIDAAANEMHASPEVFAPIFRLFRRRGFVHFTYHVGEDFVHLISGIRAIHEAINFLDLRAGNRIGHATAIGIDPALWLSVTDDRVVLTKQEWLDDLLFAYDRLKEAKEKPPHISLHKIHDRIEELGYQIYNRHLPITILKKAWTFRKIDPLVACYTERNRTEKLIFEDQAEWDRVIKARESHAEALRLFSEYHQAAFSKRGAELIEADHKLFNMESLIELQRSVLQDLHDRQIVIESMPTSNVRISFYKDHSQHHIWRWLEKKGEPSPAVCLGTDDPGIFATSIFNEYAHIFEGLTMKEGKSSDEAMTILKRLVINAKTFSFK